MNRLFNPVIAFVVFTHPTWAACSDGEDTFMSCQIKNSDRVLRVCFTKDTAHYRFGALGQPPELSLSEPIASLDYIPWSGVGRSIAEGVIFQNEGYRYVVAAGFERMFGDEEYEDISHRGFGGVRVLLNDDTVTALDCARETVDFAWGEGLFDLKRNLGFTWNDRTREWIELPD